MLNGGKFTAYLWRGLWAEVANTATILENNLIYPTRNLSPFQQFLGRERKMFCCPCKNLKDNTLRNSRQFIWLCWESSHRYIPDFQPESKTNYFDPGCDFTSKVSEYSKVEKPVVLNTSYEGSDDEEERKIVPVDNKNNVNVVRDSDIDSSDKDSKNNEGHIFDEDINDQVIASFKTTVNAKVIWAMKKLQTLYNDDANKIIKEAKQVKVAKN